MDINDPELTLKAMAVGVFFLLIIKDTLYVMVGVQLVWFGLWLLRWKKGA